MARQDRERRDRQAMQGRETAGGGMAAALIGREQQGAGSQAGMAGGRMPGQAQGTQGQPGMGQPGMAMGQIPGQPGMGQQPGMGPRPGGGRPMPARSMPGSMPEGETRAVRTAEENDAYQLGQRMGAEGLLREQGIEPKAEAAGIPGGEGPITKEKLLDADRKLMEYKAGKASVDRRIIHAQQWWKMRNWQEISGERGTRGATEKKSATAWLWNCIVGKHADAIDSYPEPIILPRMEDDRDEAQKLSKIVPVVMQMNGFEEVYSRCQWQKMQEGTAGYGVFWDKMKLNGMGDIAVKKINLLNLFWEPGITDIQDSQNLFYVSFIDNEQLEGVYPQLKGKLKNNALSINKYRTDDSVNLDDKSAVVDWYYHKWDGMRKVLHYCKYVGEEILYSTENQGEEKGLYDDGNYPFVLDPLFPVEGSPCGYGYIDIGKDAQSDIDTLSQAMVLNASASATPRYFIRKDGAINEEEFADFSKPFIHVGSNLGQDSILPVQVNVMSGNALNMLQQKIDELKFVTGNTDVNNGGTPSGVTAASAIAALKEDSGRSSKDSTKASYRSYTKIVTMVLERIRQFYDIQRQFRILGKYGEEQFTTYDNSGIRPQPVEGGLGLEAGYRLPVFDIEVRAQRENAYTKMSQNELALQFFNSGMFNPQLSDQVLMCLDMMEFKGKEELTQKVQQQGTMQEALVKVGQIAIALAGQYQPEIVPQLGATLQGVIGEQQMGAMAAGQGGGINIQRSPAVRGSDAIQGGTSANENTLVRNARERAANATRPN